MKVCLFSEFSDCSTKMKGQYCHKHYKQVWRHGHPIITIYDKRPAIIEGDIAKIPLSNGDYTIVDKEYSYLDKYQWSIAGGYAMAKIDNKRTALHWVIIGKPEYPLVTDHVNRDRLDNRKSNLRHVTRRVNNQNLGPRETNEAGYGGITKVKANDTWMVQVGKVNGKSKHIGIYKTLEEALSARLSAETIYFKEYENA